MAQFGLVVQIITGNWVMERPVIAMFQSQISTLAGVIANFYFLLTQSVFKE
jgi:hypothetical protein